MPLDLFTEQCLTDLVSVFGVCAHTTNGCVQVLSSLCGDPLADATDTAKMVRLKSQNFSRPFVEKGVVRLNKNHKVRTHFNHDASTYERVCDCRLVEDDNVSPTQNFSVSSVYVWFRHLRVVVCVKPFSTNSFCVPIEYTNKSGSHAPFCSTKWFSVFQ